MARLLSPGILAGALVVALATSGCSSSKSTSSAVSSPPAATSAAPSTAASMAPSTAASMAASAAASASTSGGATTVTVTETEFALHLSQSTFSPGAYTFVAKDSGQVSHALAISGPGVPTAQTATIGPGGSANLSVTLQKGSYELWCPVDSHKSLGMDTHITVS
ncbi:putative cupredoxin-like copper-binding protein [Streptacidiphilus sp. MAP12-33]|uniref:copper-binding protein n=1 Tax=Streptacidiphilus sp. MAP12-33 TaxID=3156266 RepID=UPI0035182C6F